MHGKKWKLTNNQEKKLIDVDPQLLLVLTQLYYIYVNKCFPYVITSK